MSPHHYIHLFILCLLAVIGCSGQELEQPCFGQSCGNTCPDGWVACDGKCINPLTDAMHCGGCLYDTTQSNATSCQNNQACSAGVCVSLESLACDSGAAPTCSDDKRFVVHCVNGQKTPVRCEKGCDNGQCGTGVVCGNGILEPGEMCDGDQFGSGLRVCPTGTVGNAEDVSCHAQTCTIDTSQCQPQNDYCAHIGDRKCQQNVIRICSAQHQWQEEQACDINERCSHDDTGQAYCSCKTGQSRCDGGNVSFCDEKGTWMTPQPCPDGQGCDATRQQCLCTPGEIRCDDDDGDAALSVCHADGYWQAPQPCTGTSCWGQKSCQGDCHSGETSCQDGHLKTCSPLGNWREPVVCALTLACADSTQCVPSVCQDDGDTCINNVYYQCATAGEIVEVTICEDSQTCSDDNGCQ